MHVELQTIFLVFPAPSAGCTEEPAFQKCLMNSRLTDVAFCVRKSCDGTQNPRFGSEPAERIQHIIGDVGLLNHVVMKVSLVL